MLRSLRSLALVLAVSAGFASSASATEFTAASYPVTYSGQQAASEPHVFTADGYTTTCKNAEFSGSSNAASTTATLTPVYTECTAFGLAATIDMNGCDYLFHLPATGDLATVDLVCPSGKDVTITAGGGLCVAHVTPFTGKSHVKDRTGGNNIISEATVSGIPVSLTDVGGFFCPFSGNTSVETATYTGNLTISGSSALSVSS